MRLGGGQAKDMQRRRQPRIPTVVLLPNCVNIPRSTRTTGELRPLRARLRHALVPPRLGRVFERGMTVHSGTGVGGFLGDGRVRVGSTASVLPFLRSFRLAANSGNGGPVVAGIGTGVIQASKRRLGSTSRNVRFGSCSGHSAVQAMSALPPKADMCSATRRCPLSAKSGHSPSRFPKANSAGLRPCMSASRTRLSAPRTCHLLRQSVGQ